MTASFTPAFPNGVSSGDVSQTSAVLWTRAVETGRLTFQIATDSSFSHVIKTKRVTVTDPLVPAKIDVDHLQPGQEYFYRVIDQSGDVIEGKFETAPRLGAQDGFHFGIVADWRGELAPFVSIRNAAAAQLDLVVKLGDTVYADQPPPPAVTLQDFQLAHGEGYGSRLGFNFLADLQATTSVLSVIDDHEVTDNFAGGAPPGSHPRFTGQPGDFINETPLYANGLRAFNQYNAIENRTYRRTGEDLFDGAPDLYRYNTYGSDAAIIMVDARSFRDTEVPGPANPLNPVEVAQFLAGSFDPSRTMLGHVQLERLKQDLLDARDSGVTWKFVMLPEPIQNFGPVIEPGDRYEGYAAERNALLKFIDQNRIENVVFVSSDSHWTSVNNLTYQDRPGGPQIATSVFEVNTLAAASNLIAPLVPPAAAALGLITAAELAFYNVLPNAPDSDSLPNDKDDFIKALFNRVMGGFGYDPIGLDTNLPVAAGKINATLLQGDYFVGHDFGWTDFDINATGELLVTTYGVPGYTAADLSTNPAAVLALNPAVVGKFKVPPTSNSIIGTARGDDLQGTAGPDVILGATGNDKLRGGAGDDYLDGGRGSDILLGSTGADAIFGRDGNDRLDGQDGADQLTGGAGNDQVSRGNGNDAFVATARDGNDIYLGGSGVDTLDLSGTSAPAKISLARGTASGADIGRDRLASVENVIGSSGADWLAGDSHRNRLQGGGGNDVMTGGSANDTFSFAPGFGSDRITGFDANPSRGQDFLDISAFAITNTSFAGRVVIADVGADVLVTIDARPDQTIRLVGFAMSRSSRKPTS